MKRKKYHKRFILCLTDKDFEKLERIAKELRVSKAVVVRGLIEKQYLILFDEKVRAFSKLLDPVFENVIDLLEFELSKFDNYDLDKLDELLKVDLDKLNDLFKVDEVRSKLKDVE